MLSGMMDRKHSMIKKAMGKDKIDPGSYSFLESGWWLLHSLMITGVFLLGCKMSSKARN